MLLSLLLALSLLSSSALADQRPRAWCGWFGRHNFLGRDPGVEFNLASRWLRIGTPTSAPGPGVIVVWSGRRHHHVGKIVGPCAGLVCPVWSGNDGGAVRTRMRSVAGAALRRI